MNTIAEPIAKDQSDFAHRLLDWYGKHARAMPWRVPPHDHAQGVVPNPYHVWMSEIMLQQTQVATVRDYFLKFVGTWPDVNALAAADLEDVLKAWAGLGYYSRARNLKKCADMIASEFGGRFPSSYDRLKKLPGIGDYTAAAISSIAFNQPVPVVDGNVERVMTRYLRIDTPLPAAKSEVRSVLEDMLDQDKPGEFAQAMMDLGATICSPKRPACSLCPVNSDCQAFAAGDMETFPVKPPKKEKPTRKGAAFVLRNEQGDVFLCKRPDTGLLGGMTQVPTTGWNARQDGDTSTAEAPVTDSWRKAGIARHTFTHFHLELTVWTANSNKPPSMDGWWCPEEDLAGEALPTVMRKVLGKVVE